MDADGDEQEEGEANGRRERIYNKETQMVEKERRMMENETLLIYKDPPDDISI